MAEGTPGGQARGLAIAEGLLSVVVLALQSGRGKDVADELVALEDLEDEGRASAIGDDGERLVEAVLQGGDRERDRARSLIDARSKSRSFGRTTEEATEVITGLTVVADDG